MLFKIFFKVLRSVINLYNFKFEWSFLFDFLNIIMMIVLKLSE